METYFGICVNKFHKTVQNGVDVAGRGYPYIGPLHHGMTDVPMIQTNDITVYISNIQKDHTARVMSTPRPAQLLSNRLDST